MHLITSLDDFSRFILYAVLVERETTWEHILALIEKPYRWIQDRLVRTCYRENIRDIKEAQLTLNNLVQKYNSNAPLIHSRLNIYYTLEYFVFNILHNKSFSLFKV